MAYFNVLYEPWIPVVDHDGNQVDLGIMPLLESAHEYEEILHENPMTQFSMYRLLSAFLLDAYRPQTKNDLDKILASGRFDKIVLSDYLDVCKKEGCSFDLFDENRPFLQSPLTENDHRKGKLKYVNDLDETMPSGQNHTHFDHRANGDFEFTYEEAAQSLATTLLFCTCGKKGPSSPNGSPPYFVLIKGKNLFETLALMLLAKENLPATVFWDEYPVIWRDKNPIEANKEMNDISILQGLIYPTRRLLLVPENDTNIVKRAYYGPGLNFYDPDTVPGKRTMETWVDPSVVYRMMKDRTAPWRPAPGQAPWLNLGDLLNVENKQAPLLLQQYLTLSYAEDKGYVELELFGASTKNALFYALHHHQMKFSKEVLENKDTPIIAGMFVNDVTAISKRLEYSFVANVNGLKHQVLAPSLVKQATRELGDICEAELYSILETAVDSKESVNAMRVKWLKNLTRYAWGCRERVCRSVSFTGRKLMQLAQAEASLSAGCAKLRKEAQKAYESECAESSEESE